mgnify:CR=1 FL=1
MKQPLKHVNFYKRTLARGVYEGFAADGDMCLTLADVYETGMYITKAFDTFDEGSTYNRLVVDGDFSDVKLEVIVAAADGLGAVIDDKDVELDSWLADPDVPMERKAETLQGLPHVRMVNTTDILLHELQGRYFWIFVGVYPGGEGSCKLRGMRLEFPKYSFTEYFPEIYQDDDFFDRFIAVFQSMYLDQERKIDEVPRLLDYESTPDENVAYLADWLGIDNPGGVYTTQQLRVLIRDNDLYQGGKGTRCAMEKIVELVTGIRPRIVEYFQWNRYSQSEAQRTLLGGLYGSSSNDFCVILDVTNRPGDLPIDEQSLEKIIDSYSVIGTSHKLVYLRRCSHTDTYCYLDVNSCLSTPTAATVDGVMLGSHITVG